MKQFPRKEDGKLDLKAYLSLPPDEQQEAEQWLQENGSFKDKLMFSQTQQAIANDKKLQEHRATRSQPNPEKRTSKKK